MRPRLPVLLSRPVLLAWLALLLPLAGGGAASAQEMAALRLEIDRVAAEAAPDDSMLADLTSNVWKVVFLAPGQSQTADILARRRADIQTGASSGASGTTSAVLSPLLPAIFGVAIEDGALTRTVSGTTVTLKAMPAGLFCAARPGAATAVARRDEDACRTWWSRVGVTASFDMARGKKDEKLASLQSLDNQFSELAVRVELLNHRKATGRAYVARFEEEFNDWRQAATGLAGLEAATKAEPAAKALEVRLLALRKDAGWKTATADKRRQDVEKAIRESVATTVVPEADMQKVQAAWLSALQADERLQNAVANAPVLTAEYTFQRPDLATEAIGTIVPAGVRPPELHTGRVIYAQGWADSRLDVTANLSFSLFDELRPGMRGRFRDLRTGVEAKFKLRELANYGAPTLAFAGLYTFLNQEPLGLGIAAFNGAAITERGHIGLFQFKLEFPAANNTIRIPLSLTYSNRTELIKESDVRGQIGISFNLDALFLDTKPKS